jgi:hypothetical protein
LDDVTPLRQASAGMAAGGAHLFVPRTAVRVRRDENQDTPLTPEVPAGKNPPDGAIINYYLPPNFSGDVQVEIRDESGNVTHNYSSAPLPKQEEETPFVAEYWIAHPQPLSKSPGMHRFVWNLRYTDPQAVHVQSPYNYPIAAIVGSTPLPPEGPLVLPGKYEVQLKAGGQTLRQTLEVKEDPRVHTARNELESALDLQLKISEVLVRNYEAHQQVKQLRARLSELLKRPKEDPVAVAAKALDDKLKALEGEATPLLQAPKRLTLMAVNDSLTNLMALVDGADFAPSEESFAAFHRVCQGWKEELSAWQELKNKDVEAFNAVLSKNNLATVPSMPAVVAETSCGN